MNFKPLVLLLLSVMSLLGCSSSRIGGAFPYPLQIVDKKATYQTKALFYNLQRPAQNGLLFGQQDATQYGIGWKNEPNRSDVKSVSGSHPAVYGWDVADIVRADLKGESVRARRHEHVLLAHAQLQDGGQFL